MLLAAWEETAGFFPMFFIFLGRVEAGADAGRDKADVCPPKRRDEMDARFEACIFYAPAAGRPAGTAEKTRRDRTDAP